MKLIIAGSREFSDYDLLEESVDLYIRQHTFEDESVEIVSGTAKGADQLGEKYAAEKGYTVKKFPADWDTHGKSAGYKRNLAMAEYATHCICFWDGKSRGTGHMIDIARNKGLELEIV